MRTERGQGRREPCDAVLCGLCLPYAVFEWCFALAPNLLCFLLDLTEDPRQTFGVQFRLLELKWIPSEPLRGISQVLLLGD